MTKRVFIIAGEASGDILGAGLVRELKKLIPNVIFSGVGGEEMAQAGVKSIFPISDIAVMGLTEVVARLPLINKRLKQTIQAGRDFRPDLIITIDAPGFTGRVAQALKGVAPLVHYVAPSVWAYKPKRAAKLAGVYDLLLCFFDFERPYFEKHGLKTVVVGHPAVADIPAGAGRQNVKNLVFLPGSRVSMAARLLPVYKKVISSFPGVSVVMPVVETNEAFVRDAVKDWPVPVKIISTREERYKAFARAGAAVSISGTAVLELALMGVPSVAVYKASAITALAARVLLNIKSVTLPNIILGREMVKELLQGDATAEKISHELVRLMHDKPARAEYTRNAALLRHELGRHKNPNGAAARAVAGLLK